VSDCEPQETRKIRKLKTPEGPVSREIVYRDWRVRGAVADQDKTEIVVADTGRIIFGECGCAFFQDSMLAKGPCEHMIALFQASADSRKDLPTSVATKEEAVSRGGGPPRAGGDDTEDNGDVDDSGIKEET
jgi:hypothetical protein